MARPTAVGGALILDAEGIVKLADGSYFALSFASDAYERGGPLVTAASTAAEVLRGGARDVKVHRVLNRVTVMPVDRTISRAAGDLLGQTGLTGHRCTIDALLAAVALRQPRPTVLLTSDPEDMLRLTEEPGRPRAERIAVVRL